MADLDLFATPSIRATPLPAGACLLQSTVELHDLEYASLPAVLAARAAATPDRPFLAERVAERWEYLTYRQAWQQACRLAALLPSMGAGPERPVAILAENGIGHAVVALGAMLAGVPASPISTSYSLLSTDHAKLRYVMLALTPSVLYVDSAARHAQALEHLDLEGVVVIAGDEPVRAGVLGLTRCLQGAPEGDGRRMLAGIGLDSIAKVLFTSGSTALPKGVIQTHRMMLANQQAIAQVWPFLAAEPPVLADWLPWNHVFGGNQNFNMALVRGGTLYIDPGRPVATGIERTLATLREVAPTVYFNVPRGFDMLVPRLEADEDLARHFFSRLRLIGYAGAALAAPLWERLERLARKHRGAVVPMAALWGSTETAPVATLVHFRSRHAGNIGVPVPGCSLKLVPNQGKHEVRVKGPCVTPGYWRSPEQTAAAFDEDGFYRIGDALRLADAGDPSAGLLFDGRIGENFKLSSGTWVNVGSLRVAAIATDQDFIQDVVVAGHNREAIGLLVFPKIPACRALLDAGESGLTDEQVLLQPPVLDRLRDAMRALNGSSAGSSTRVRRAAWLAEPPSVDANEITDKGYINQRAVLERRSAAVEALFARPAGAGVVEI